MSTATPLARDRVVSRVSTVRRQPWPALDWVHGYEKEWLRADIVAGLTAASVVIPKAMAYASIAGLPVQYGIYTALTPTLIYAVLGTSRPLSVSTSTTIAILLGASLHRTVPNANVPEMCRASAMTSLLVGIFLVLASVLRLGFVAEFISEPILVGFKAGIGLVITVDQAPKLLGIKGGSGSFIHKLLGFFEGIPETSGATLAVGAVMIISLISLERLCPKMPAPLFAVFFGIAVSATLDLKAHSVACVPEVPRGLPPVTLPQFSLADELWPGALAIALMSFTETIAAGRAFATDDEPPLGSNRELLATGLANIGGAFLGSLAAGGGTTQTAVNRLAGARTQLAEVVTASTSLLTLLLLSPLLGLMPEATLAAVVIVYSVGLVKPKEFKAILRVRRTEFIWALVAFLGVVLLGTLKGILVAMLVTLASFASQTANAPVHVMGRKPGTSLFRPLSDDYPEDETFPGLLLVRLEGRICFANANHLAELIRPLIRETRAKVLVLDLSGVHDLEYTALSMMVKAEKRQRDRGVSMWLAGLGPDVLAMVRRSPLGATLGEQRVLESLQQAVERYLESSPMHDA